MFSKNFFFSWGFVFIAALLDCITLVMLKYRFNQVGNIELTSWQSLSEYITKFLGAYWVWIGAVTFFAGPLFGYLGINKLPLL